MQITKFGQPPAPIARQRNQQSSLPRDVVLIGELRHTDRLITRNTLLALTGTALVTSTAAMLASGQQSALLAALVTIPIGLVAARWLNSDVREHKRQIEEQLNR